MRSFARALALASFILVAACAKTVQVPSQQPPPQPAPPVVLPPPVVVTPPPANAREAGVVAAAPPATIDETSAARALSAFRISCPSLQRRQDKSLLSDGPDWTGVCAQAAKVSPGSSAAFFRDRFDWVRIGDGNAFATGYYIPEARVRGRREQATRCLSTGCLPILSAVRGPMARPAGPGSTRRDPAYFIIRARRSRTARWPGGVLKSPGPRTRSNSSSSRSRDPAIHFDRRNGHADRLR